MGGTRLVPRYAESAGEEARRDAEALVVDAVRFCDECEPLDTMIIAKPLLREPARLWGALMLLSAGRFAGMPATLSRDGAKARASWFSSNGWYTLGAFIASRLDLQLCTSLLAHAANGAAGILAKPLRRVPASWYCSLPSKRV